MRENNTPAPNGVALTDTDLMPFGKHKGKALANVPATYLLWLYNEGLDHGPLKQYIIKNMDVLREQDRRAQSYKRR